MSGPIRVKATHEIIDGRFGDFEELGREMLAKVEATEPGYLSYEWFLDDDGRTCTIVGTLESSEAVLHHLANAGEMIGRFGEIAPTTGIEIFGDPSDELSEALASFGAPVNRHWGGFTR